MFYKRGGCYSAENWQALRNDAITKAVHWVLDAAEQPLSDKQITDKINEKSYHFELREVQHVLDWMVHKFWIEKDKSGLFKRNEDE